MDRNYLLKSAFKTALIARLAAKLIDLFIVVFLVLTLYPFGVILALTYLSIADHLMDGQSPGKKLIGLGVLSLKDGKPCTLMQSLVRNLPLTIPMLFLIIPLWGWILSGLLATPLILLELYLLTKLDSGHRLGDVMADTTVIANDENRQDLKDKKDSWYDNEIPIS